MNSVHEPGSNGDSKTSPSRKPGRKTKPGARAPNWPSWPSLHSQAARAWPCRGRSWPCRGRAPRPCRSARRAPRLHRAPSAARPRAQLPPRLPPARLSPAAPCARCSPSRSPSAPTRTPAALVPCRGLAGRVAALCCDTV